jgi:hypothetical protein
MQEAQNNKQNHIAGIIPVAGAEISFGTPWPDCMQPISDNYLAIERSVEECAYAGCRTIWIVANDDVKPVIKHRLGDFVTDPASLRKASYVKYPSQHRKDIPILYLPIHPKDRDRRDSYGFSVLYGALRAFVTSQKISKWLTPSKYYVSFPYGIYDPKSASKLREQINGKKNVFMSYGGKTIKDGEYLGFSMSAEDYKVYMRTIKNNCTGGSKDIPASERWSSRHLKLDKIFNSAKIEDSLVHSLSWYNRADDWVSLRNHYTTRHSLSMIKAKGILKD